ncbi:MAG: hypothetical protein ACOYN0_02130 [Phycisphaerales bacterium]
MRPTRIKTRRGFAMLIVLGIILITAFVLVVVQTSSLGQASSGRESLARTRAAWAARAGIEATIARLEFDTQNPNTGDAYAVFTDLAEVAQDSLQGSSFRVVSTSGKQQFDGPGDPHAKLNINVASRDQLLEIEPFMTEDVADAILDWIDSDDDVREVGAELGYYQSMPFAYLPRNGPMRSIQELELVAGVDIRDVRGEDWNLNGILDDNENDGETSWPPDNADGVLDAAWSGVLTAVSAGGSAFAASGEERLDLTSADDSTIMTRTRVNSRQAEAILAYVQQGQNPQMRDFLRRSLAQLAQQVAQPGAAQQPQPDALTTEQLGALLNECSIGVPDPTLPGKININTCDSKLFEYLPELDSTIAETLVSERAGRSTGFLSMAEVLDISGVSRAAAATMYDLFDVRSDAFEVTCRGTDANTGIEVEICATIDRSTLPVVIKEIYAR